MKKIALITGASSGIGKELAIIHAKAGGDLVIVARNTEKLIQLKGEIEEKYQVTVHVISKDLSIKESVDQLFKEITDKGISINYLINNAGFGEYGEFQNTSWDREEKMIALNITTLTQLCKLFIPHMIRHGGGRILNVASTAAFQPGPLMAVYYATKAFVLHFSEAIGEELKDTGITVTALCPGATQSNFFNDAQMNDSKLVKGKKLPSSEDVANYGYRAMKKGKSVAIHGIGNFLLANSVRFSPRFLVLKMVKFIQRKSI